MKIQGFFKKVFIILGCIICATIFCCLNSTNVNTTYASNSISFEEYANKVSKILSKDDYSLLNMEQDLTYDELISALDVEDENIVECSVSNMDNKILTLKEIDEVCSSYGYEVSETNDGYSITSKFMLKRLIVTGEITDTCNASTFVTGYKDKNILCYDTIEETEYAYNQLILDENLEVVVDFVVSVTDNQEEDNSFQLSASTTSHNSWGADFLGVDDYIEYLGEIEQEVVVAVLDTGINTSHEIFTDRFLYENGQIMGYSFYETNYDYSGYAFEDDKGHGTHVAGTICDLTPKNVKIYPVKVLNSNGDGTGLSVETGIEYVGFLSETYNVVAMNMSLAGKVDDYAVITSFDPLLKTYREASILPVVAAGNEASAISGSSYYWPAACPNAITVTALKKNEDGTVEFDSSYSNYSSTNSVDQTFLYSDIDFSAPGTGILSAWISSDNTRNTQVVHYDSGTSMATPHVSAVVALVSLWNDYWYETNNTLMPRYTHDDIEEKIYNSAIYLGDYGKYGQGMISIQNFLGNIEYDATNTTVTYDGSYHNIGITVSEVSAYTISYYPNSKPNSDSAYIEDISTNNYFKNATDGAIPIYFLITTTESGYGSTYGVAYLTITPRPITIKLVNRSSTYGAELVGLGFSLQSGTLASGENNNMLNITPTTTATSTSDAGTYPITASCGNTNYSCTWVEGVYTINPRDITVDISDSSEVYGNDFDASKIVASTSDTLPNDETIEDLGLSFYLLDVEPTSDVGIYEGVIRAEPSNINYNIDYNYGTYTITQRAVNLTVKASSVYGYTPTINNKTITYRNNEVIDLDSLYETFTLDSSITNTSPVQIYQNVISCELGNTNYYLETITSEFEITPRPLTITISDRTCVYGEEVTDDDTAYTITNGEIANNDNLGVDLTVNLVVYAPAKVYITGTSTNTNYDITFVKGTFTISARPIKISTYQTSEYGDDITLDNTIYTLEEGNLVEGDTNLYLTFSTTATKTSSVDSYPITLSSYSNTHYDISLVSGVYEITKKGLLVKLDDQSSVYGENTNELTYEVYYNQQVVDETTLINFDIDVLCNASSTANVGDYPITATNNVSNSYDITFTDGVYSITTRKISITISNSSSVYGYDIPSIGYRLSSGTFAPNDNITDLAITSYSTATKESVVGSYDNKATTTNTNYDVTFVEGSHTISKRAITISTYQSSEYGKPVRLDNTKFNIDSGSLADFDKDLGLIFATDATSTSNIGKYPITMAYTNTNYDVTLSKGEYSIVGKIVSITIGNKSSVYGETLSLDDVVCTVNEEGISLESLNISLSSNALTEKLVGEYDIVATCGNVNYSVDFVAGKYTISKREISISSNQTGEYGKTPNLDNSIYEITAGSLVGEDQLGLTLSTVATKASAVGEYDISLDSYTNTNYDITLSDSKYTVTARPITIKVNNSSSVYGDEIVIDNDNFTVTSTNQIVNNDNLNLSISVSLPEKNSSGHYDFGRYPISFEYDNPNYSVSFINSYHSITKRPIEIAISTVNAIYGDLDDLQNLMSEITSGSLATYETVDNLGLTYSFIRSITTKTPVGEYSNSISATSSNSNYNVSVISGTYNIGQREIVISTSQSGGYGLEISLDNTNYDLISGNVVNDDDLGLQFSTTATIDSPMGEYRIDLDDYSNKNYLVSLQSGLYTITARNVIIIIDDIVSQYGEDILPITYSLSDNTPLIEGDAIEDLNISLSTSASKTSVVGEYPISANYVNSNYTFTFENKIYKIIPKDIIIIIDNATSVYGEEMAGLSYALKSTSVLVGQDKVADLNVVVSTDATMFSDVIDGGYAITGSYNNPNYNVTFEQGVYTISPCEITISTSQTGQYGDIPNLDNTVFELVAGVIVNVDDLGLNFTTEANETSPIGTYDINLDNYTNTNYIISLASGVYSITPREIRVVLENATSVYGANLSNLNYHLHENYSLVAGDTIDELNVKATTTATNTSPVNDDGYTIDATYNNSNYIVTFERATYSITPKPITIKIYDSTSEYTENLAPLNYQLKAGFSLVGNDSLDDLNILLSTDATTSSQAYETFMIVGTFSSENYIVSFENGTYSIKPLNLNITLNNQSGTYGDVIILDKNLYEITNKSNVNREELNLVVTTNANQDSVVGEYVIMASSDNSNYKLNITNGIYTINKRKITIKLNDQKVRRWFEFNVKQDDFTVIDGSLAPVGDFKLTVETNATMMSGIGKVFDLTAISNNPNYDVTIINGKVKMQISITDILGVAIIVIAGLAIVVAIIRAIANRRKRSKEFMAMYNDWISSRK